MSTLQGLFRQSTAAVWNSKLVWLMHVLANATLFVAFFYWLRIPDERGWQFSITIVTGLAIAFLILWLHCATFDHFRTPTSTFSAAFHRTAARVPWFLIWMLVFAAVLWLIGRAWSYDAQLGGWTRHSLPEFLRRSISPRSVIVVYAHLMWFAFYFLWPILFLPVAAQTASYGWRGFAPRNLLAAFRPFRDFHFWILYTVCFLLGAFIPYKLAYHTPVQSSPLSAQTASLVIRLGLGYLLLVTMWLILSAAITRCLDDNQRVA